MAKKYPCPLRQEPCDHAGNKHFDWGFTWGLKPYCRKAKRYIPPLRECPKEADDD